MPLPTTRARHKSGVSVGRRLLPSENSSAYSEPAGDGVKSNASRAASIERRQQVGIAAIMLLAAACSSPAPEQPTPSPPTPEPTARPTRTPVATATETADDFQYDEQGRVTGWLGHRKN